MTCKQRYNQNHFCSRCFRKNFQGVVLSKDDARWDARNFIAPWAKCPITFNNHNREKISTKTYFKHVIFSFYSISLFNKQICCRSTFVFSFQIILSLIDQKVDLIWSMKHTYWANFWRVLRRKLNYCPKVHAKAALNAQ